MYTRYSRYFFLFYTTEAPKSLSPGIKWFHLGKDDLRFEYKIITAKEGILKIPC